MEVAALAWVAHDTRLIFCCLAAILTSVLLLGVTRLPPFLSILIGIFIADLGAGGGRAGWPPGLVDRLGHRRRLGVPLPRQ